MLTGDAQILYERKKEISIEEIQGQIDRMMEKKDSFHNPVVIDVNPSVEQVIDDVACAILDACARKEK